jgi:hypothetical protein
MWKLPAWYGTSLVCLMLGTTLILRERKLLVVFFMAALVNVNALVLLIGLTFENQSKNQDELAEQEQPDSSASTELLDPKDSSSKQHSNVNNDKWFGCCCCTIRYPVFFVWAVLLSTTVLQASSSPPYVVGMYGTPSWLHIAQTLFLLSFGLYLAAAILAWCQRGYIQYFSQCFCWREWCNNPKLSSNRNIRIAMIICVSLLCFTVSGTAFYRRKHEMASLFEVFGRNTNTYFGEAHVSGYEILNPHDDDDNNDESWCPSYLSVIPVNVTVAWGGSWGCPMTGTYCESVVTTVVSCVFKERLDLSASDDDIVDEEDMLQTEAEYVDRRFHYYHEGDDDDAAFNYDADSAPQYSYWNRPSEAIVGACSSCEARSQYWVTQELQTVIRQSQVANIMLGMGLMFFAWPLVCFHALGRSSTSSIAATELIEDYRTDKTVIV